MPFIFYIFLFISTFQERPFKKLLRRIFLPILYVPATTLFCVLENVCISFYIFLITLSKVSSFMHSLNTTVSQTPTDDLSTSQFPVVITDSAPLAIVENLHSALMRNFTTNQSYCLKRSCNKNKQGLIIYKYCFIMLKKLTHFFPSKFNY